MTKHSAQHKPKFLAIGFYAPGTGLSRVMEEVLNAVKQQFDIDWLGIGYTGEIIDQGYKIYPTNPKGGDIFAAYQAKSALQALNYDVLFILADIWQYAHYIKVLYPVKNNTWFSAYIPLDGNISNSSLVEPLQKFNDVTVYTDWAANQLSAAFAQLEGSSPAVDVIGHGIETDDFHPLPDLLESGFSAQVRTDLKQRLFPDLQNANSSFIVLNPSRPAQRKHVELTIEGFAKFSRDKPNNVKLCLHHAIRNKDSDAQVSKAIAEYGIKNRIIWNPLGDKISPVADVELNQLYQGCDLGLNTSSGEGWGLVSFEHAASGAAQIIPDHSACSSLWRDAGVLINTHEAKIPDYSLLALSIPKLDSIVEQLEHLFWDKDFYQQKCCEAYALSTQQRYLWSSIRQQWRDKYAITATHFKRDIMQE